jgi:hypothetical protein
MCRSVLVGGALNPAIRCPRDLSALPFRGDIPG